MAKKKRNPPGAAAPAPSPRPAAASAPAGSAPPRPADPTSAAALALPAETVKGDWTVALLALMMFLAPALGVPNELMLQDTLKSIIVSFAALGAALLFFWNQRNRDLDA